MYRQTINIIRNNKTYCTLIATMILASYSFTLAGEINDYEPYPDYYANILPMKMLCDYDTHTRGFLKYWSNCFSYQVIGHDRIIPIMASISIVYLTYVISNQITNNRIIGLIAMGAMTQNPLLTRFDSSPTYDQIWVALFLLSIFLLYKKPVVGIILYPVSILSKVLSVAFIPGLIINVIMDKRIKNRKAIISLCIVLGVIGLVIVRWFGVGDVLEIHPERLLDGFLRIFESIWPIFPLVMGVIVIDRFFMPKQKTEGKKVILMWIVWILITTPLIYLFTPNQLQFGYRFVPFASFFSIYLGIVLVQLSNFIIETRMRKSLLSH